ncbi:hypothetical protein [Caballeronia sp. LZ034LL]|uniref:hypothetical protein n=1 Tax=Caballeronia sp. LZ034LL TaxID=3038567 RepID=UPI00285647B8|nr:hypothetical protein [Caballeronia sp. LZ034LL]MDR5835638.1 hypothetical protein [Caballeronia sp. LZ034LL]
MDEKKVAELRKFVITITDPKVSAFIDLRKLCQSGIYNLAVQMATEHAAKRHDFSYLEKILTLLDGSTHASGFIASLRPKLNFIVSDTKPRKFKKATPEQIAKAAKQAKSKPVAAQKTSPAVTKKVAKVEVSQDLLDSRLMLPGSYGTGRRR